MKVSIVIINHNDQKWLPFAISSCLAQTHTDLEVVIVDDHSSDSSRDVIAKFASQDERIKPVFASANLGTSAARNLGITHSTGSYVALLDADDVLLPCSIEYRLAKFNEIRQNHPDLIMLTTDAWIINEHGSRAGRYMSPKWFDKVEILEPPLWTLPSCWFFERTDFSFFCPIYGSGGDALFFINWMRTKGKIAYFGVPQTEYRLRLQSVTNTKGKMLVRERNAAILTVEEGRFHDPIRAEDMPFPTWREYAAWTYGRSAKAAAVNRCWGKAFAYSMIAAIADFKKATAKVFRFTKGLWLARH